MFIRDYDLRKRLGMSKLMEADTGANGGTDSGTDTQATNSGDKGDKTEESKTFTQADVDKLIQDRVAREKKNQLSKEELESFKIWKESQKTEEEKKVILLLYVNLIDLWMKIMNLYIRRKKEKVYLMLMILI